MADIKWSAFPTIGSLATGDILVGLRAGANVQFSALTIPWSVANGGTGRATATAYALIAGGTTSTGALQSLGTGTAGQLLQSNGAAALPTWTTSTFPAGSGTLNHMLRSDGTNWVQTTATTLDASDNFAGITSAAIGNLSLATNTLSSTNSNGNIAMIPNGTGAVVVGGATAFGSTAGFGSLQIAKSSALGILGMASYSSNLGSGYIWQAKSRSTTLGVFSPVLSGDHLGELYFSGDDGTQFLESSLIRGTAQGSISTGIVPGQLEFYTVNTSGSQVLGMKLTNSQNLVLTNPLLGVSGGTGVANTGLTIDLSSGASGKVLTSDSSGNATWASTSLTGAVLLSPSGDQTITAHNLTLALGSYIATLGNYTSGTSSGGIAGSFVAYPNTASTGSLTIRCSDNSAAFGNILTNASTTGTRTWTLPDATGTLALTSSSAQTFNGDSGSATPSAGVIVFTGSTTGLTFTGSGNTLTLGGTLVVSNGGTGRATATAFGVIAGGTTATGAQQSLATGSSGQLLQSAGSSSLPAWTTATFPSVATTSGTILRANGTNWLASTATFADTYGASTLLYSNGANTVTGLATANSAVLVTSSAGVPVWSSTMTNGQVIIGSTGATPTAATLTAGTGISITNGAASITINATASGLGWSTIAGTTQAAAVDSGYVAGNAAQTTVTLPATAALGSEVAVEGLGAGGWILAANTGQTIKIGTGTTSTAGSLTSAAASDNVYVICIVQNTTWRVQTTNSAGLTIS